MVMGGLAFIWEASIRPRGRNFEEVPEIFLQGSNAAPNPRHLPVVVGPVKRDINRSERWTNPDYPRGYAIVLEKNSGRSYQFLHVTLCAQFNKTEVEADYILRRVGESGRAVINIYGNRDAAEGKMLHVNECLEVYLGLPPLSMDLERI